MHPYSEVSFFEFFGVFLSRILGLITGKLDLATDEVQLIALFLVGLSCSLLGAFLLLKKMTMVANSLSHTVLLGIVLCYLWIPAKQTIFEGNFFLLFVASFISALLTLVTTHFFTKTLNLQKEASVGLVFTSFFSLAILLVNVYTKHTHLGIEAVMGNIDAMHQNEILPLVLLTAINGSIFLGVFRGMKVCTFDKTHAFTLGFSPRLYEYLLLFLLSLTLVGAFRAVGVLLVLAFLVIPYLTVRIWSFHLSRILQYSCLLSFLYAAVGVALARHLLSCYQMPISTSGLVVVLMGIGYVFSLMLSKLKEILPMYKGKELA